MIDINVHNPKSIDFHKLSAKRLLLNTKEISVNMTFMFFSFFSIFYIKKIQSTGSEPWEYHVDELGPGGQHRSSYTAKRSKDVTIFKKKRLTHPIEHGKSEHEKVQKKVQPVTNNEI